MEETATAGRLTIYKNQVAFYGPMHCMMWGMLGLMSRLSPLGRCASEPLEGHLKEMKTVGTSNWYPEEYPTLIIGGLR